MERNPLTLQDLNFYYPHLRQIVLEYLEEDEKVEVEESIITKLIQTSLKAKMKDPKSLKAEIVKLREADLDNK